MEVSLYPFAVKETEHITYSTKVNVSRGHEKHKEKHRGPWTIT